MKACRRHLTKPEIKRRFDVLRVFRRIAGIDNPYRYYSRAVRTKRAYVCRGLFDRRTRVRHCAYEKREKDFCVFWQRNARDVARRAMITFVSAVKHILTEGKIIDTVINGAIGFLQGRSPYVAVLLIFALVLF